MLRPKPRDADGFTIPHNHEDIAAEDLLVRGIPYNQIKGGRISSGAFKSSTRNDPYFGMSVDILKLSPNTHYPNDLYAGAVMFEAQTARNYSEYSMQVGWDPIQGTNEAHGQVWRTETPPKKISTGASRTIQRACRWHFEIPDTEII